MLRMAIDEPKPVYYLAPKSIEEALRMAAEHGPEAAYLAGGCDLMDQIKHQWNNPRAIINLKTIADLRGAKKSGDNYVIGSLTRLADIERDAALKQALPALVMAATRVATPQIRNLGTVGGNLLQDSRCPYYRGAWLCYRAGGLTCDAHHGINDEHAILGADRCYTVTPSDLAPAVVALDARITAQGQAGERSLPAHELFVSPSADIRVMHRLQHQEILTLIEIPLHQNQRSAFVKNAVRNAWDFSRASVAVSAIVNGGICSNSRIVLGGVAAVPWRSRKAEQQVNGQKLTPKLIETAAEAATEGAAPLKYNGYKVPLVRKLIVEALTQIST